MLRRLAACRKTDGQDEGFALVTVVATMMVLSMFLLAATLFAVKSMPSSRRAQDYAASMAAAQAGIDDVLSRLNQCDSYWMSPCAGSAAEPGRWDGNPTGTQTNKWAPISGATASRNARYRYTLVSTPTTTPGLIRVRADGEVNGVRRTITADLRKDSFLKYIYYTDFEALSPELYQSIYGGTQANARATCGRYYYSVPPATGTRSSQCDINFVGGDVIRGPLYTNDALLLMAYNGISGPKFLSPAETNWRPEYSPASDPSAPYRKNGSTSAPAPGSTIPIVAPKAVNMPASNSDIKNAAISGGCVFEGPTRIVLNSTGTVTVTSPLTTLATLNPGCAVGTPMSLPANGVIFVQGSTKTPGSYCVSGKPTGVYPIPSTDITSYDCTSGDVFLEGTLTGKLTIATERDIIVTDDVLYNTPVYDSTTGNINMLAPDVLGLVAQGSVRTFHPVASGGTELKQAQVTNLEIDAAILSVDNSFTVQNYRSGAQLGSLRVRGGIYQRYRGPVGTSGSPATGYLKDYVYDQRLISLPPPHFLEPTGSAWGVVGFSE